MAEQVNWHWHAKHTFQRFASIQLLDPMVYKNYNQFMYLATYLWIELVIYYHL